LFNPEIDSGTVVLKKNDSSVPDTCVSDGNAFWMGLGIGASKRFYFRRLAIKPFTDFKFGAFIYDFASIHSEDTLSMMFGCPMISAGSAVELAILPDLNIGVSFWYRKGFPYLGSMTHNDYEAKYPETKTGQFVPSIKGLGYTFHITAIF
jgi:hypothetical protein